MREKLRKYFALSEKGVNNTLVASRWSFLKFLSFVFPPILTFFFLQDVLNGNVRQTIFYMGILVVIAVVMFLILAKEYKMTYDVTYEESIQLRIDLANKLKELPLSYFSTHNLSDLSQTVMMDVGNIEMVISHAIPAGIGFAAFFILMTILMCISNPILGLTVTLPIWLGLATMFLSKRIQQKGVEKYYNKLLENSNAFQEAFEMQEEIKSYSMQDQVKLDVEEKLDSTERIHLKAEIVLGFTSFLVGILPCLAPVLTATVGAVLYISGSINVLYYVGYLMAAMTLSNQFAAVGEFIMMIFFFETSYRRIGDLKAEPVQTGQDKELTNFDVKFDNVEFQYGDNKVIKGLSFVAKQNEVTAIVGPSGCGKTTVLRLVSRLYDYDKGMISLGGHDIKNISTKSLFDKISIVFQNVELFDCSVMENIRMGRKGASDEEVMTAAKLANVEEIVAKLPNGYNTLIGENGSKLSGGERQRISIARAFLKDAPIILLDEISASLDVENEMEIQDSLNKLIENKTVIIISHRLKSIEKADKIVVMKDGVLDSEGGHDDLLAKSNLYRSMVEKSRLTEEYVY
ncbi:ABC transporter ATP-binding protein [Peptostreptococcus sp. MV1]|uniref:ABC transporter ATP-binding protein n=1 Tax=Peptostreptococcus sp. MV1 TaxID=1219626 RepID=UPI00050E2327|nr:ABC transporter ATP-binding protein [Peptostreptococcus sp. MV1]KGF14933.1 ABC transporter ATP-binding protein [Peptostreptococcus sp. MV1]